MLNGKGAILSGSCIACTTYMCIIILCFSCTRVHAYKRFTVSDILSVVTNDALMILSAVSDARLDSSQWEWQLPVFRHQQRVLLSHFCRHWAALGTSSGVTHHCQLWLTYIVYVPRILWVYAIYRMCHTI